jgi:hypothetical protein
MFMTVDLATCLFYTVLGEQFRRFLTEWTEFMFQAPFGFNVSLFWPGMYFFICCIGGPIARKLSLITVGLVSKHY